MSGTVGRMDVVDVSFTVQLQLPIIWVGAGGTPMGPGANPCSIEEQQPLMFGTER